MQSCNSPKLFTSKSIAITGELKTKVNFAHDSISNIYATIFEKNHVELLMYMVQDHIIFSTLCNEQRILA
jgi:hypothetical protein